jgi:hypothetical protein
MRPKLRATATASQNSIVSRIFEDKYQFTAFQEYYAVFDFFPEGHTFCPSYQARRWNPVRASRRSESIGFGVHHSWRRYRLGAPMH